MGRLREETLTRVQECADRVPDVAVVLEKPERFSRVIDQWVGSGSSVGAHAFEADQAMTAKNFAKTPGIVVKESSDS
jgi:hypothetical protein